LFGKAGHALEPQVNETASPHWIEGLRRQWRPLIIAIIAVYLPAILLLRLLGAQEAVRPDMLLRDPAAIADEPFYLGALSNFGLLLWAGSVSICLLTYAVLVRDGGEREWRLFFLAFAAFTSILMFDDMLMLHESVMPDLFGLPDKFAFGLYAILALASFVGLRSTIFKTHYLLLLVSLSFFALSILVDIQDMPAAQTALVEDGAKLLGILGWFVYFIWSSAGRLGDITRVKPGKQTR